MTDGIILWEAHRAGAGGYELPESCLAAFEYGWSLGADGNAWLALLRACFAPVA